MTTVTKTLTSTYILLTLNYGDKNKTSNGKNTTPEGLAGSTVPIEEGESRCGDEGHRVENADLNDDGVTDVRTVWALIDNHGVETEVMVCKETDLNFDGKKDIIRYFSDEGRPLRHEIDLDFDGHIDVITYFEDGKIIRSEYDTNFDGKVDMWNYYANGKLKASERDRNGDGQKDEWQHFDEEGNLVRIGYDTDGDGKVDHWERADTGETIEEPEEPDATDEDADEPEE
jgi:antitoxin component YwqK of YwqJK toxin-antitoxin module